MLIKFIPEEAPTPDEIKAIQLGRDEIRRGKTVSHDEIGWRFAEGLAKAKFLNMFMIS